MVPRPYTLVLLEDPALQALFQARDPANTVQRHALDRTRDPNLESREDGWLRWLRICFGCETG